MYIYEKLKGIPSGQNSGTYSEIAWQDNASPLINFYKDGKQQVGGGRQFLITGVAWEIGEKWTFSGGASFGEKPVSFSSGATFSGGASFSSGATFSGGASFTGKEPVSFSSGATFSGGASFTGEEPVSFNGINTPSITYSTDDIQIKKKSGSQTNNFTTLTEEYVKATYFDTYSDKRLKENIITSNFNALDLINKMKIKEFNFKNSAEKNIGLIAQELLEIQPKDLSLVNNPEASGKDDDFMSIRESKLVYILLKAVQELSCKIEELKKNK